MFNLELIDGFLENFRKEISASGRERLTGSSVISVAGERRIWRRYSLLRQVRLGLCPNTVTVQLIFVTLCIAVWHFTTGDLTHRHPSPSITVITGKPYGIKTLKTEKIFFETHTLAEKLFCPRAPKLRSLSFLSSFFLSIARTTFSKLLRHHWAGSINQNDSM